MTARRKTANDSRPERQGLDLNNVEQFGEMLDKFQAATSDKQNGSEPAPPPKRSEKRRRGRKPASSSQKTSPKTDRRSVGDTPEEVPKVSKVPPELAYETDILAKLREDLPRAGLAGEEAFALIGYLTLTTRHFPWGKPTERPASMIAKGGSSTGKSHGMKTMLGFHPPEAYFLLTSASSKAALLYADRDFRHCFLVVAEWAAIKGDDELVAMVRTLLSEGYIAHLTVDEQRQGDTIKKEGPTGLLLTTTAAVTDYELETRCLSVTTDDSPEQTKAVYDIYADLEEEKLKPVDFKAYHDLQRWIVQHGEKRVVIQWMRKLGELMPKNDPRMRRDYASLLCLVRAHAVLHQRHRDTDDDDRIIATIEGDYAPVRNLVTEVMGQGVKANVSKATRETVEAVKALITEQGTNGPGHVSVSAVEKELGIGQAVYGRVSKALAQGYLIDTNDKKPKRLVLGNPLPGDEGFLPTASDLLRSISDSESEIETAQPYGLEASSPLLRPISDTPPNEIDWDGQPKGLS